MNAKELPPCPKTIEADRNALDYATSGRHYNGHRFMRQTTYLDGSYDAMCLTCGRRAHLAGDEVVDTWT